ncbi:hypothetical protein KAFR_0B06610 [Kazachstania africana CBS 2517]|uniref:Serine/threonine-protein phosphatase n=1 Tax=Kazachstania africana (strain ATCC 22294 / BCRC 22015 / CBS 2517 / CECT 1963 / NBRC 1671 / NRRL Y-8276) TaxID=1071382 RepID=H2ARF7_KAZAF|nr:hypothetical protein KAFR_0B06610 [Kazachstania africana CBS 2517]CCF56957.1 hypothetical protein KAFR_0B06610 [Kazachstania africana CBS 2517]
MAVYDTELATSYKDEGNKFLKQQDFQRANELYTKAIETDPTQSIFYSNRALANLKLDNFMNALNDCTNAIELNSSNLKAYHRRGLANIGLLNFKSARNDFNIVLKYKPNDIIAKNGFDTCEKVIREERFKKAIGGSDEKTGGATICQSTSLSSFDANADLSKYAGPELEFKQLTNEKGENSGIEVINMSQSFISSLVNDVFLKGKNLPKKYAAAIISHCERLFRNEPTLVEISNVTNPNTKISVCGDTHGQFYDVLNIFKRFGKVSENHTYLFNGDFVDRGSWSCEVAILFYCLKILFPNNLFINRGNHETDNMNKVYGFEDECNYKYSKRIFQMFSQSFESLPLATLINNDYLVMHGGLPSDTSLTVEDIKSIDRFKQPPRDGLFMELLWSDPQAKDGFGPSQRGLGFAFGSDITAQFIEKNNLRKIFRSHEVRMNGYEFEHNKKLITVFSAPNYCDSQGNLGSIIHVVPNNGEINVNDNDDENLIIETFDSVSHPDIKPMAYSNGGFGF